MSKRCSCDSRSFFVLREMYVTENAELSSGFEAGRRDFCDAHQMGSDVLIGTEASPSHHDTP